MTDDIDPDLADRIRTDPYCAMLGITVETLDPGVAETELTITDDHLNFHDTPHGGAIYSLADAAFAAASNSHGDTALALETNISYLDTVDTGTTVTARAEETHRSPKTAEYEVTVTTGEDRIATFRGRVYRP